MVAPLPELRPLQIAFRDMGHAPVGRCDQTQLFQPLVPVGIML